MNRIQDVLSQDIPLHHQIYLQVRTEINDGLWVGREGFPGEDGLAERFGVSVITARKALERLTTEGWVERSRGRRPRVIRAPAGASVEPDLAGTSMPTIRSPPRSPAA